MLLNETCGFCKMHLPRLGQRTGLTGAGTGNQGVARQFLALGRCCCAVQIGMGGGGADGLLEATGRAIGQGLTDETAVHIGVRVVRHMGNFSSNPIAGGGAEFGGQEVGLGVKLGCARGISPRTRDGEGFEVVLRIDGGGGGGGVAGNGAEGLRIALQRSAAGALDWCCCRAVEVVAWREGHGGVVEEEEEG